MKKTKKLTITFQLFTIFLIIILFQISNNTALADSCSTIYSGYSCMNIDVGQNLGYVCYAGLCPGGVDNVCCGLINNEALATKQATLKSAGTVSLPNPLGTDAAAKSPQVLLGKIINSVLGIIGSLALVMFIYGGATWMLSAGNQEKVTKGKQILIWATLGLVVIFTAYALVRFVLTTITA